MTIHPQFLPLRQVIESYVGGGWGKDAAQPGFSEPAWVIRGTDIPAIRAGAIDSCPRRFHASSNLRSRRLSAGDLVFEVSGGSKDQPVGRPLLVDRRLLGRFNGQVMPASFCKLLRPDPQVVDSSYLFYVLQWLYDSRQVTRFQVQSTGISNFQFETFLDAQFIALPGLDTQRKIAAILSAYDDLIDNNNRRTKLLDEMPQRIYREWFVDFRYPGHGAVPLVDSEGGPIPADWTRCRLCDVVAVNARTARTLTNFEVIDYIDISSVETGFVRESKRLAAAEAPGRARRLVADGDIIWSTVRPNRRSFAVLVDPSECCIVSTGFAVLSPTKAPSSFVYALSSTEDFATYLANHATGSAYPAVTGTVFEQMPILFPAAELVDAFDRLTRDGLRLVNTLRRVNENLKAARDILLPRLISGEIDVGGLNIEIEDSAA